MSDKKRPRLKIEDTLPIRAVGIENERERRDFTHLPPQNYIHVWWARRPTPVTRLAILSSLLSDDIDEDNLIKWMGMNPNNKSPNTSISEHIRKKEDSRKERDGSEHAHFGYRKIWRKTPDKKILENIHTKIRETWDGELPKILDATAGGGSIPFECIRYGIPAIANELNPVASVILKAVLEHPRVNGDLSEDIEKWGQEINNIAREELNEYFPSKDSEKILEYLWAHTITCPDCGIEIPLSPNWWLKKESANEGISAKPEINDKSNKVSFKIVKLPEEINKSDFNPTKGTVSNAKATCPSCKVVVDGDEIKKQANNNSLGFQIYAIRFENKSKAKKGKRGFRTPSQKDLKGFEKARKICKQSPELSSFLSINIPTGKKTNELIRYGMSKWKDIYTPRQLLVHYTYWKAFKDVKEQIKEEYSEDESKVILTFLALAADKALAYNCRESLWDNTVPKLSQIFDRHDFAFAWSFAESNIIAKGLGYEWIVGNVIKAYKDLYKLSGHKDTDIQVYQGNANNLKIKSKSVDAIVLDPPYYDNVMYAELSDFFYVWMRKYLEDIYPNFFHKDLTDKEEEAVANSSRFKDIAGKKQSKKELANKDYEKKMTEIFNEMYRVLKDKGIFTLMFTHKKTEAWDTLTKSLIEAGFVVKATHPISTENPHSLNQSGKNAAESTILLASEKRTSKDDDFTLWSDVKNKTREAAINKVEEIEQRDIKFTKVDMILASFGPTLQVFTENYPVIDDEGNEIRPQMALDEARNAVRDYLIENYLNEGVKEVDLNTEWYILSWLVFEAERFPYDEANRLGKGLGVEIDDIKRTHRLWRKKGEHIVLRSYDERVQTPADKKKSRTTKPIDPDALTFNNDLDKVHSVMYIYKNLGVNETINYIKERGFESDRSFKATFEGLLRVIPHTHKDWEILRDMALTDVGKLIGIDVDPDVFKTENKSQSQSKMTEYVE